MVNVSNPRKWWKEHFKAYKESNPFKDDPARKTEWDNIYNAFDIAPKDHPKIVDFGCGTGFFALKFLKKGYKVTGIDLSDVALGILKQRAKKYDLSEDLETLETGLFNPDKKLEGKFDAGYMIVTYHCISNNTDIQKRVFKNFTQLIKRGGRVLIMEPNPLNPLFYIFYLFVYKGNIAEGYNIINSRKEILVTLLKETGMTNIKIYRHSFLPTFLINRLAFVREFNRFLCSVPVVRNFCAFHIFTAEKL